ncbi:MAG: FAD-binding oxidoreductase, partial [Deltaproteobacteria bacterium]
MDELEQRHRSKVARIARQLREHPRDRPVSLRKGSVSHQVPKANDLRHRDDKIDVGDLTEILSIDPVRRICVAESGVTFVDLVAATLAHGLVPIVVPELKTITIGGAVAGCSIESMSFVHGGFHDTCLEYEVITATGEVLTCTPDNEHRLVFQMMHGAFGTLGIIARLTFKLITARPYVKLRYETHATIADYQAAILRHFEARDIDFMDGIIHSPSCYVLSTGDFVDTAPYTSDYRWMKIYYQSTRTRREDYLTTPDYFFRYDRGVTNVRPRSFLGRLVLGRFLASSQWLRLGEKLRWLLRSEKPTITLDVFVPFSKVPGFLAWYERTFGFYPLWCVPYRRVRDYEWLDPSFYAGMTDQLFLDLAIYGMRQRGATNYHRLMEDKLREIGGIKTLIAHNYYGEDEFWSIWNKRNYDAVKAITDPENQFRDLYTKT